jgi:hypothetical protein
MVMKNKIINRKDREKLQELPNPRIHQTICFMKSMIRFGACTFLGCNMLVSAAIAFGIAEVLGIIEEIF